MDFPEERHWDPQHAFRKPPRAEQVRSGRDNYVLRTMALERLRQRVRMGDEDLDDLLIVLGLEE